MGRADVPPRAPPRALSWAQAGTGWGLLFPCPAMQRGLDPRGWIPGAGSQRMDPRGWIPVHRSQGTLQCCTSLLQNTQQPLPGDVQGARQRLCKGSRVPAASPLLLGPVAVVTLGQGSGLAWLWLVRDNPVLAKAAPNPRSCAMDAAILGLHRALSLPLSPQRTRGSSRGSPAQCTGWFLPRSQLGAWPGGPGRMQGLTAEMQQHLLLIRLLGLLGL